ncbi:unnamed protein product [Protopolystoma xenopodis]|uniref:Uncharacterized protein n=1 Tax=Protopolystoma xenopodis TaxID=117903 RepID=A0A3S5FGC7_9PLAT|nr:unnamed protein product [Protopolystoma xenopodis]
MSTSPSSLLGLNPKKATSSTDLTDACSSLDDILPNGKRALLSEEKAVKNEANEHGENDQESLNVENFVTCDDDKASEEIVDCRIPSPNEAIRKIETRSEKLSSALSQDLLINDSDNVKLSTDSSGYRPTKTKTGQTKCRYHAEKDLTHLSTEQANVFNSTSEVACTQPEGISPCEPFLP